MSKCRVGIIAKGPTLVTNRYKQAYFFNKKLSVLISNYKES